MKNTHFGWRHLFFQPTNVCMNIFTVLGMLVRGAGNFLIGSTPPVLLLFTLDLCGILLLGRELKITSAVNQTGERPIKKTHYKSKASHGPIRFAWTRQSRLYDSIF